MALVGNRFSRPMGSYPAWTTTEQPGDLFCVPGDEAGVLILKLVCCIASLVTSLLASWWSLRKRRKSADPIKKGRNATAAWEQSAQLQMVFLVPVALLLLLYIVPSPFTCMVTFQKLRFPSVSANRCVQTLLELAMSMWTCCTWTRWHDFTALSENTKPSTRLKSEDGVKEASWQNAVGPCMLWNLWSFACLLLCAPATLYAAVKAIPGFLGMERMLQMAVDSTVSILTAVLTSLMLPWMARLLCTTVASGTSETDLLLFGRLLAAPILPCVITLICHADCLGTRTSFWQQCQDFKPIMYTVPVGLSVTFEDVLLMRSDVCGMNAMMKSTTYFAAKACASDIHNPRIPDVLQKAHEATGGARALGLLLAAYNHACTTLASALSTPILASQVALWTSLL
eukprot:1614643-Amphidinium_carterae.2